MITMHLIHHELGAHPCDCGCQWALWLWCVKSMCLMMVVVVCCCCFWPPPNPRARPSKLLKPLLQLLPPLLLFQPPLLILWMRNICGCTCTCFSWVTGTFSEKKKIICFSNVTKMFVWACPYRNRIWAWNFDVFYNWNWHWMINCLEKN